MLCVCAAAHTAYLFMASMAGSSFAPMELTTTTTTKYASLAKSQKYFVHQR